MAAPSDDDLDRHLRSFVSEAISVATRQGLPTIDAVEATIAVAADLARGLYGDSYLQALAQKVVDRAGKPFSEQPR